MPSIALHARQQLALTPRLQQAVRLLQLSSLEFQQEMREALDTNPFLEYAPTAADAGDGASTADGADGGDRIATAPESADASNGEVGALPGESSGSYTAELRSPGSTRQSSYRGGEDGDSDAADWVRVPITLREQLHEALRLSPLDTPDRMAAHVVIEALDDDGYLRQDLAELAEIEGFGMELDEDQLRVALRVVQSLDRPGIGARSLSECLALQLEAMPADTPQRDIAYQIVTRHLERLARREHGELQRQLGCDAQSLQAACALVRRLDPKPGNHYGRADDGYVVPDVIVRQVRNRWVVTVNPAIEPRARIHTLYAEMFARSEHTSRSPLAQQLQEARWLIRNAHKRCETIQRVGECIVARQKAFFQYGEIALRPLLLRDVADELGLHESTVSRATGNKYMATPRGIFEFKRFFPRELETRTGGTCSAAAVRALIKEMIDAEDARNPLSDVALTETLGEQGVRVARRTVTKYRQMLKLPAAELRRHA
ncbi:RNA polymerase factor sigma-54 [Paraburkholderia caballeronis]|uniref:RNA polymerase factor sigma-54 n=1 Tax=Paraburkholderia caballeronis TaxID=416943 RepID=UPI001064D5AB|nr:RNA polymerase factor sigma-54 [Paraburkholderia caballeronis]TDV13872.1 RNA polymerase RpoN-/SigL-like sigma 54 subunit [Paraburkholderia caballeronis]TDV15386.1 RNA polymerase RpoN-/SigL-like sigma 54 subunit [Paraburkholderia caballeronis]TDV24853.1 RNA polymerase RpoN-/SigL-like sigma 54 subunit [Paraburkholderia caballeronis]